MKGIFKKLNLKDQKRIILLNAPESFTPHLLDLNSDVKVSKNVGRIKEIEFVIAFAIKQKEVDEIARKIGPKLFGDAVFWICYPKKSSKKYQCEFNRDTGWNILGNTNWKVCAWSLLMKIGVRCGFGKWSLLRR